MRKETHRGLEESKEKGKENFALILFRKTYKKSNRGNSMKLKEAVLINESLNSPVPWREIDNTDFGFFMQQTYKFRINEKVYHVNINSVKDRNGELEQIVVDFERDDIPNYASKISLTGDVGGSDAIKVMATVLDIIKKNEHINKAKSFKIEMDRDETSRVSLYKRMINKYAKSARFGELGGYVVAYVKI
tara:strand:+ start:1677 stop:2246 length:570 start_codon:yes stop_codon:yes gene_type:complete